MTEPLRDDVLKMGIEYMDKYDEAFKQLAAIEREELKEELEVLKKKNFQDVADACMEEYTNIKTQNKINNYQKPEIK